jgi:predicted transposase YbfD/YdcC
MENAAQKGEITSYFEALQAEVPDHRGKQGRVHELAFVLCGVLLALLTGRLKVSEIHRYMTNHFEWLKMVTGFGAKSPVSDGQLRRILREADHESFNAVNRVYFGVDVCQLADDEWVSVDGKELRGSLEVREDGTKDKRGEVVVNAVRHKDSKVVGQVFYRGDKESEKPAVRELLEKSGLKKKSVTLDALHCDPATTAMIEQGQGRYIVQVKENQAELLEDLRQIPRFTRMASRHESLEKGHGRVEYRAGEFYSIEGEYFDERWKESGLRTLGVITRQTRVLKTGKESLEVSYYISSQRIVQGNEGYGEGLFGAIRGHWAVEADNHVRDVTLGEDSVRAPKGGLARFLAVGRTWAIQLLRGTGAKNLKAQMEKFADVKEELSNYLKIIGFST